MSSAVRSTTRHRCHRHQRQLHHHPPPRRNRQSHCHHSRDVRWKHESVTLVIYLAISRLTQRGRAALSVAKQLVVALSRSPRSHFSVRVYQASQVSSMTWIALVATPVLHLNKRSSSDTNAKCHLITITRKLL